MKKFNLLILCVVVIGLVLRFAWPNSYPPSLNWDEASLGYNAYSISQNGTDEWGVAYPTIFRAFGDYKLPVYVYTLVPLVKVFGLNTSVVRFPSVMAGTLSVLFTYLLVIEMLSISKLSQVRIRSIALVSALLMAIEPWSLFPSRVALEANLCLFFVIAGSYFLISGIGNKKSWKAVLGALALGLSVWTYNSARIFVPLLTLIVMVVYAREIYHFLKGRVKTTVMFLAVFIIFFIPMFSQLASSIGQARYGWVKIVDDGAILKIESLRSSSHASPIVSRAIYNKVTYFLYTAGTNYVKHFSSDYLFFSGGSNYQFSVPGYGVLYWADAPFFILGLLYILFKLRKERYARFIFAWLIFSPIASSITRDAPHVLRSIVILPTPMIISALGIFFLYDRIKIKFKLLAPILVLVAPVAYMSSAASYLDIYMSAYSKYYAWAWQYGYEQVVDYIKTNYSKYDQIIITKKYGEPHEFLLYFQKWDPKKYITDPNLIRYEKSNWYWVDRFDKFYFVNDWQIAPKDKVFDLESGGKVDCTKLKCLLITGPVTFPTDWHMLDQVNFKDGTTAFRIYENTK